MTPPVDHATLVPLDGGPLAPATAGRPRRVVIDGPAFDTVLRDAATSSPVQFSRHALQRLERRGIAVDGPVQQRLDDGVQRAAGKGAREAVVFVDGTAFVVSVRNRTVITAVDRDHMRDHVFTNIDSAVIA
jgi:flagellar operon protein